MVEHLDIAGLTGLPAMQQQQKKLKLELKLICNLDVLALCCWAICFFKLWGVQAWFNFSSSAIIKHLFHD